MMTRTVLTLIALCAASQAATAQGAPATKAPAAQEQPGLFTRLKRMVGLEKEPAPATQTKTPADTTTTKTKAPATGQDTKAATATKGAGTKAAPAGTKAAPGTATKQGGLTVAPEIAQRERVPTILREVFDYEPEGRRDPFFSLLTTSELRPALVDLRLTGVILDPTGRRSVAIMRDLKDNTQYRVTTGMTLGRMRVALIKARSVIFSIEEFGLNRQDSLVLGDTTKVRGK